MRFANFWDNSETQKQYLLDPEILTADNFVQTNNESKSMYGTCIT